MSEWRQIAARLALASWCIAVRGRDKAFTLLVRRSFAEWGQGSSIRLPVRIYGERGIAVGADVQIGEGSWLQAFDGGTVEIGDHCRFSGGTVISAAHSIVLEDDVLVARNVHILDHIHEFGRSDLPIWQQGVTRVRPVRIGRGAWIGANVVVLPGVTIGQGAVVGANSVVDRDIPARTVAAGAPVKTIRSLDLTENDAGS